MWFPLPPTSNAQSIWGPFGTKQVQQKLGLIQRPCDPEKESAASEDEWIIDHWSTFFNLKWSHPLNSFSNFLLDSFYHNCSVFV